MPAIKTAKATYILNGSINNINKYIGYSVEMNGNIVTGPQGIQLFNVKNYKIIKTQPLLLLQANQFSYQGSYKSTCSYCN
jgi:hypothetical protein